MKEFARIITLIGISLILSSCERDREIEIGTQIWMAKNLNVNVFRNGDTIPNITTQAEWLKFGREDKPAWCYFDNNPSKGKEYGKLYNWHAVTDPRGLAPEGWHVPGHAEWTILTDYLGEEAGKLLKSTDGWIENGNGTNTTGFTGLPGGYRNNIGAFRDMGVHGSFWSSTERDSDFAWGRYLNYSKEKVTWNSLILKADGMSVRCIKN